MVCFRLTKHTPAPDINFVTRYTVLELADRSVEDNQIVDAFFLHLPFNIYPLSHLSGTLKY